MNLEKLLFKKISVWILLLTIILSLIFAIWFGYLTTKSRTVLKIAKTPDVIKKIFTDFSNLAVHEKRFNNKQGLYVYLPPSENKYLLLSRYDGDLERSIVELIDLRQKKKIHEWKPDINKINSYSKLPEKLVNLKTDHNAKRYAIGHPFLLNNGDLLIKSMRTPLTKIDICSKLIWTLDYAFHHSIEKDHENNFWIPFTFFPKSVDPGLDENYRVNTDHFIDDGIMKISDEGKFLFKKSIIQIFIDNNLEELIVSGQTNFNPIHLNDIQPVLFDGPHFKTGDIFLSLKNLSMIILYRPSTNKIIWYKRNPWIHQHDVDILNDNQISVFNNKNYFFSFNKSNKKNNNVLIYDFDQDVIINNYEKLFNKYDVRTPSQGLSEIMEDGSIFIEESDFGRVMEINRKGNLVWEYINRDSNGELYPVLWSRPLKKINNSLSTKLRNNVCDEK